MKERGERSIRWISVFMPSFARPMSLQNPAEGLGRNVDDLLVRLDELARLGPSGLTLETDRLGCGCEGKKGRS